MTTDKAARREAILPRELIGALLAAAGERLVLVGGQALAFWVDHYRVEVPGEFAYVSRDIDFLAASSADAAEVRRLADVLGGHAVFPHKRALTALIGQAIKEVGNGEFFSVDVLHRTLGGRRDLRQRAVDVELAGRMVRIMHPIDVVASRLTNLYKLPEKQNDLGDAQMRMAIRIGQRITGSEKNESVLLKTIEMFAAMARNDAGRKVAERRGLHVADSIDPANALHVQAFRHKRLPLIMRLMSEDCRAAVAAHIGARAKP